MPRTNEVEAEPIAGRIVSVTRGVLAGATGKLVSCQGRRWMIELTSAGAGVYLVIDQADCSAAEVETACPPER